MRPWYFPRTSDITLSDCDLLRTVDSTGRGSLCYNGECWAVSLVHPYKPILETLTVTRSQVSPARGTPPSPHRYI